MGDKGKFGILCKSKAAVSIIMIIAGIVTLLLYPDNTCCCSADVVGMTVRCASGLIVVAGIGLLLSSIGWAHKA